MKGAEREEEEASARGKTQGGVRRDCEGIGERKLVCWGHGGEACLTKEIKHESVQE